VLQHDAVAFCRFKEHLKHRQAGKTDVDNYDMHKRIEKWYWKQVR
jgi:hypothetical protein